MSVLDWMPIEKVKSYFNGESSKRNKIRSRIIGLLESSLSEIYNTEYIFCHYDDELKAGKEGCTIRTFDFLDVYKKRLELICAAEDALGAAIVYNRKVKASKRIDLSHYSCVLNDMMTVTEHEFLGHNDVLRSMNGCSHAALGFPCSYKPLSLEHLPDTAEDPLVAL